MIVLTFQSRFAPLVRAGTKAQTIRGERKRPIRVGDDLSLRQWSGSPYRSKQVELRSARCTRISRVEIIALAVLVDGRLLTDAQREDFAQADGFGSGMEMADWFENVHGCPFAGVLIGWSV